MAGLESPVGEKIGLPTLGAADVEGLKGLIELRHSRAERTLGRAVDVRICYEAGYEGFWLARWLDRTMGLENMVLEPSVEALRRVGSELLSIRLTFQANRLKRATTGVEKFVYVAILPRQYGRHGYRRIAVLLRDAGWQVNAKRVERLWRREGLKVPQRQPKRRRLWLHDGSCVRLRPAHRDHVWSYDFVHHRTDDGRAFRILNILDEYTRECLLIPVRRKLASWDVLDALSDLFLCRGVPGFIRSDNGPEFVAGHVQHWIATAGAKTAYIEPGSPWENGYVESFNARFRDELLDREIFTSLREAQILIEAWRRHYNTARPHSALGYRPPAPETIVPPSRASGSATLRRLPGVGRGTRSALTLRVDQSIGAGQFSAQPANRAAPSNGGVSTRAMNEVRTKHTFDSSRTRVRSAPDVPARRNACIRSGRRTRAPGRARRPRRSPPAGPGHPPGSRHRPKSGEFPRRACHRPHR